MRSDLQRDCKLSNYQSTELECSSRFLSPRMASVHPGTLVLKQSFNGDNSNALELRILILIYTAFLL